MANLKLKKEILKIVDNQLKDNDPPATKQVFQKLLDAGYSTNEAKENIGSVVLTEIYNVLKENQVYNEEKYTEALEEMAQQCIDLEADIFIPTEWNEWDELVQQGYEMQEEKNTEALLECWREAWDIFREIVEQQDEKKSVQWLVEELDYQYPIDVWLQDFEMELGNAKQHEKHLDFCKTVLEMFDWTIDDDSDFLAGIGESLYGMGKVEEGRIWFEKWLKREPQNEVGWIAFSWCVQRQDGEEQAYQLIRRQVIGIPCTIHNSDIFERAMILASHLKLEKDLKWIDTQLKDFQESMDEAEYYGDLFDDYRAPVQRPLVSETKIYPNEPCPCGSGKKYKKCCGRE